MQLRSKAVCALMLALFLTNLIEARLLDEDFSRVAWEFQGIQLGAINIPFDGVSAPNCQVEHIDGEGKALIPLHTPFAYRLQPEKSPLTSRLAIDNTKHKCDNKCSLYVNTKCISNAKTLMHVKTNKYQVNMKFAHITIVTSPNNPRSQAAATTHNHHCERSSVCLDLCVWMWPSPMIPTAMLIVSECI